MSNPRQFSTAALERLRASAFHPELRTWARLLPRDIWIPVLLRIQRKLETRWLSSKRAPDVEPRVLPDGTKIRVMVPKGADRPLPCLVWVHSGGYIMRSAAQDDPYCRHLVNALECVIVNVDYRLAPEHPYPAGLEDCYSALLWAKSFDAVDNSRIAIAGASGGGGLAAALGLLARERGEVNLVAQVLSYPMLDDRSSSRSDNNEQYHRVWSARSNEYAWSCYLGTADRDVAVPGRRADLAGLPPTWLGTGDRDLFHDEIVSYGQRLDAAGVPTQVVVVPGAFHGFDVIAPHKHISRSYFDSQVAALRSAFDATTPDRPHAPAGP